MKDGLVTNKWETIAPGTFFRYIRSASEIVWLYPVAVYGPEDTDDECFAPEFRSERTRYASFVDIQDNFHAGFISPVASDGFYVVPGTTRILCFYCGAAYFDHSINCQRRRFDIPFTERWEEDQEDPESLLLMVTEGIIDLRNPHHQETGVAPAQDDQQLLDDIVSYGRLTIRSDAVPETDHWVRPVRCASDTEYSDITMHSAQPQRTSLGSSSSPEETPIAARRGFPASLLPPGGHDQSTRMADHQAQRSSTAPTQGDDQSAGVLRSSSAREIPRLERAPRLIPPLWEASCTNRGDGLQHGQCSVCYERRAVTIFCPRCRCFICCRECATARPQLSCPLCQQEFLQLGRS